MAFLQVRIVQVLKGVAYLRQHFVGLRWLLATLLRETFAPLLWMVCRPDQGVFLGPAHPEIVLESVL
jgi:hypothetical protein